jgi:outer membrane protein TolC
MKAAIGLPSRLGRVAILGAVFGSLGCQGPLDRTAEQELREQMLATHRQYMQAVAAGPIIECQRPPSEVDKDLTDARRAELDKLSGPGSYQGVQPEVGADLLGHAQVQTVGMSLRRAVELAAQNNLQVQLARLVPAVSDTQVTQADAAFDAVYYANYNLTDTDTPRPPSTLSPPSGGELLSDTHDLTTGIRQPLTTGGQVSLETEFNRNHLNPTFFDDDPYFNSDVLLNLKQPLLRNFGSDVNRAQVLLAQSSRRQGVEDLRKSLLDTIADTEKAYWQLVFDRQDLMIRQRLLARTMEDRNRLKPRQNFDASPVQITEVNSSVESRRADVIRARQEVRHASDALKQLVNAPDLPVTGETLIQPLETPADLPVNVSLLDAVTLALRRRPELQKALLQIKDASLRQRVADNLLLPQLDLNFGLRFNGEDTTFSGAYTQLGEGNFIDFLVGFKFEAPLGNRAAEGLVEQRRLERRGAAVAYQAAVQSVVVEVKDAMRAVLTDYELIGAARAARRAAQDNLRAIEAQQQAGAAMTPEFFDLKLRTEADVATAEEQEFQALSDYSTAISAFYRATGTLLERNGIDFRDDLEPQGPETGPADPPERKHKS